MEDDSSSDSDGDNEIPITRQNRECPRCGGKKESTAKKGAPGTHEHPYTARVSSGVIPDQGPSRDGNAARPKDPPSVAPLGPVLLGDKIQEIIANSGHQGGNKADHKPLD